MDKPFITVSGVSKKFEGEEVLREVSVEIREGEQGNQFFFICYVAMRNMHLPRERYSSG